MGSTITKIEYYLPDNVLTNEELSKMFPDWDPIKIEDKIGIRERRYVSENQTALDLAYKASKKVLNSFDKDLIDFVLLCTQSPDYFLPTSACLLQNMLDLRTDIGAFDFNLGCSGFVYGLALAKSLINSNIATNVLLVTSETYTKHIHHNDKSNRTIFGDGAAATIISKCDEEHILDFVLGTDGKGKDNLIINNGGLRKKADESEKDFTDVNGNIANNNCLYMNGPAIFNFTIEKVPALVKATLEKNKITLEDIDYVVFHQANKYMLEYLRKKIKIPVEKFYINMLLTGNTVSATIPIALNDAMNGDLIKKGDKILLVGFGVGYSWSATVIQL